MSFSHYLAEFSRIKSTLPGRQLPWLTNIRDNALASFRATGFPTLRDEEWKYTNVAQIENGQFELLPLVAGCDVDAAQIEKQTISDSHLLVFIDGRHVPALSRLGALPAGVTLASLANVLEHEPQKVRAHLQASTCPEQRYSSGFAALNAACMADGAYIHLAADVTLDAPIELLFFASAANLATHCRNLVIAERGSRASIVEHHVAPGPARYFSNSVTDIEIGRGAAIEHYKLQQESPKAFHVATVNANLDEESRFLSSSFALGGALARLDINVGLDADGAECNLDGLYVTDGRRHVDHHTRVDHTQPRGTSREFYKGVLAGASRAVFNGKVIVHPDAQHSDAFQTNRNLLLSEQAEIDTKPQLEIWADDVKCGHGATVGQLDDDQIFYLRSRGVDAATARALLTYAFAAEMVERICLSPLRARVDQLLRGWLRQHVEAPS